MASLEWLSVGRAQPNKARSAHMRAARACCGEGSGYDTKLPTGLNPKLACVAAGAGSTPQLLRACIIHACMATLLEVGAVAASPEAWTALHLKPVCSSQAHEAARQLQNLVLRELPEAMLQSSSPASAHAAE